MVAPVHRTGPQGRTLISDLRLSEKIQKKQSQLGIQDIRKHHKTSQGIAGHHKTQQAQSDLQGPV